MKPRTRRKLHRIGPIEARSPLSSSTQQPSTPPPLLILFQNILFRAPLRRLPIIMPRPRPLLRLAIAHHSRHSPLHPALKPIANALPVIAHLALGLLALARGVLALAFALQVLRTERPAHGFFRRADGLIPGAGGAARVVGGNAARGGDGNGTELGNRVRGVGGVGCAGFVDGCFFLKREKGWGVNGGFQEEEGFKRKRVSRGEGVGGRCD